MNSIDFRLCTYRRHGFTSVGLGVGSEPQHVVDVERSFIFLNRERGERQFLLWPTRLDMLQVMTNWDYFYARFVELARRIADGVIPDSEASGFMHRVSDISFAAPISNPRKILNAGGNYYDHMEEMGVIGRDAVDPKRDAPYIFVSTADNTLIGDGDTLVLPKKGKWPVPQYVDWEVELFAVVGRTAKNVSPDNALDHIAGYMLGQDISGQETAVRFKGAFEMDWYASKSNDTFKPTGPWIVPTAFVSNPGNLRMKTIVNGEVQQDSNTNQMIWGVAEIVSYASSISRLEPGDLLATGTCAGCGGPRNAVKKLDLKKINAEKPEGIHYGSAMLMENLRAGNSLYLRDGDILISEIEGLGRLTNRVVYEK